MKEDRPSTMGAVRRLGEAHGGNTLRLSKEMSSLEKAAETVNLRLLQDQVMVTWLAGLVGSPR